MNQNLYIGLLIFLIVLIYYQDLFCQYKLNTVNEQFSLVSGKIFQTDGTIRGKVLDEKGIPVPNANIIVLETFRGTTSDDTGVFVIKNLDAGQYTIKISHVGYETKTEQIKLPGRTDGESIFYLKSTSFLIGGIEVTGSEDFLPYEAVTKTYIYGGEIEHFQASSVKDVLDLVPGIRKTDNPTLSKFSQAAIRSDETDKISALGTLVLVDGVPVSNNADLQFERMQNSNTGISNIGGGADLRKIPADNIDYIEAISGIPSVKYGDLTEGVINIKTKSYYQTNRLKIKNNPDTHELNACGVFPVTGKELNYNLNLALSERDIRIKGDEYSRLTGQLSFSDLLFDDHLEINHKVNGQLIFDEEEPKGDIYRVKNYNRGSEAAYSTRGKYFFNNDKSNNIEFTGYINLHNENSMKSRLIQSDLRILPNGDTISSYLGKVETKGKEWLTGFNLNYNRIFYSTDLLHKFLAGTELRYEANTGEGIILDTLFNYYGGESGIRPYNFDKFPGQLLLSFYSEDAVQGNFPFDFLFTAGFRYELYRPYAFNFKGLWGNGDLVKSRQGSFFNPRLNLLIPLSMNNQLRISYGTTSKSPSMNYLYPPEEVLRWRDPNTNKLVYFRFNKSDYNLKGIREEQLEVSFDQKIMDLIGSSVTGYYKERKNEIEDQPVPVFVSSSVSGTEKIYFINYYLQSENLGWTISKGLEFVIRTKKIEPLNMSFTIIGTYSYLNSSRNGYSFDPAPDISKGRIPNFKPDTMLDTLIGFIYSPRGTWSDRLQMNYFIRYTLPILELWVTLRAEQIVFERNQNYSLEPVDFNSLSQSDQVKYNFDREIVRKTTKWLFNINVSKSLWEGAEVSFYINNIFDDPAIWQYYSSPTTITEVKRNPALFYGI
jgi:hypothetical protein